MGVEDVEQQIKALRDTVTYILRHLAHSEGLPESIADDATTLFMEFMRKQQVGHSDTAISASAKKALILAARQKGIPIRDYHACFRLLKYTQVNVPYSPDPYILWIGEQLKISEVTKQKAKDIANEYRSKTFRRGAPRVLAAASIYLASLTTGEQFAQEPIAQLAQCTTVSIRNVYHEMRKVLRMGNFKYGIAENPREKSVAVQQIDGIAGISQKGTVEVQEIRCWKCAFLKTNKPHSDNYYCPRNNSMIQLVMPFGFAEKCSMFKPKE